MRKIYIVLFIGLFVMMSSVPCWAASSSSDLLRQGLLGAGAGAVGGAASGAKGRDVWKGALAGAGVNIIGGALLDSISGEKVQQQQRVQGMEPRDAYGSGYQDGYYNGYKAGYTDGFREGMENSRR